MLDIYLGIGLMVCLSIVFFAFALMVSSRFPRRVADFFAILVLIGMCLYIYFLWDKAEVTWLVPYSNAIIIGNWFPIITAVLSALVYHRVPKKSTRKYWIVLLLNLVGFYSIIQPIVGSVPVCRDEVVDQQISIARQTSQVSCSPTSAVNLLTWYGIRATESEMADLCLTRESTNWLGLNIHEGGTSWLGLYRGFKLKLKGTNLEPRFLSMDFESFFKDPPTSPLIVSLALHPEIEADNPEQFELFRSGGWQPGVEHNVVYLRLVNGRVAIIDPKIGYEELEVKDFAALWVGRGIYLEVR